MATTADEVWQLLGELLQAQKQTDRKFQETDRKFQETNLKFQETDRLQKENARQIRELGKQIGGLGAKFGSFTEGLALPSMETILRQQFGMEIISPSVRVSKGGEHLEIDVLAYTNGEVNRAMVVEVKSHAREESITQLVNLLSRFRHFFPEHKNKQVYGILAAVDMSVQVREKALQAGLYVARIQDEVFELDTPPSFHPRVW
ncbi:DUF3782 domain-containing protein [Umezakia ovalisporum]|uniref:DUF3782 domain-containing protein n=1 Tax=Umezakia ovalisporum FSS-62 TaxID=2971776 RepID=A0AA43GXM4_9CYAN|nr:DUF3782 domain-containing protein [Umezakia ovalisporum]MDH6063308.1 DUF3782 domain-containing protein [Umezakia ovalisporum FSS-62]